MPVEPRLFPVPTAAFSITAYAGDTGWKVVVRQAGVHTALPTVEAETYDGLSPEAVLDTLGAIIEGWALESNGGF